MNNQNDNDYISPAELYAQFDGPETPLIIDVRGADEFAAGHILGAIHIPADELNERLDEIPINRSLVPY